MRATRQEHQGSMNSAEIDALPPLRRPHDLRLAGVVMRPDMPLQPLPRQLVGRRIGANRYSHRKFAVDDLVTVRCFASHNVRTYSERQLSFHCEMIP